MQIDVTYNDRYMILRQGEAEITVTPKQAKELLGETALYTSGRWEKFDSSHSISEDYHDECYCGNHAEKYGFCTECIESFSSLGLG